MDDCEDALDGGEQDVDVLPLGAQNGTPGTTWLPGDPWSQYCEECP